MRALLCAALLALAAQSGSAFSLLGKWSCAHFTDPEFTMSVNLHYRSNGRSVHDITAQGASPDGFLPLDLRVWGTWSAMGSRWKKG